MTNKTIDSARIGLKKANVSASDFRAAVRKAVDGHDNPVAQLEAIAEAIGETVESIDGSETKTGYRVYYINMGDPYVPTFVYDYARARIVYALAGWARYVK